MTEHLGADVRRIGALLAAVGLIASSGCDSTRTPATRAHGRTVALEVVAAWPTNTNAPARIVGDPEGPGAWWFSQTRSGGSLFDYVPGHGVVETSLDEQHVDLSQLMGYGLAVTSTDVVLGTGPTILDLDRATGVIRHWTIPQVDAIGSRSGARLHPIVLSVASGGGTIAYTVRGVAVVGILRPADGHFSAVKMPANTLPLDVAETPAGAIASTLLTKDPGYSSSRVYGATAVIARDASHPDAISMDSYWIAATNETFMVGGNRAIAEVSARGTAATWTHGDDIPSGVPGVWDPEHRYVVAAGGGTIVRASSKAYGADSLPLLVCDPRAVGGVDGNAGPRTPFPCPDEVTGLAVDRDGTTYVSTGSNNLGLKRVTFSDALS